jgi:hypothetical protein
VEPVPDLGGLWLIRERNYNETGVGSMRLGSLFLNIADADDHRPANHLIGRAGASSALTWGTSAGCSPTHPGHVSGFKTTGVRLCCSAHNSFGVVVMMVKLRTLSPAG